MFFSSVQGAKTVRGCYFNLNPISAAPVMASLEMYLVFWESELSRVKQIAVMTKRDELQ